MTNINNFKFCIYDTETTGLDVFNESILEMAFLDLETGDEIFHEYIFPSNKKKITNSFIHNIDEKFLEEKNALNIDKALTKLNNKLKKYYNDQYIILVAHNNFGYDQLILECEYRRSNIHILKNILFFDSLPFFRKIFTELTSFKLENIYNKFFKVEKDAKFHTAIYDTECLRKIFNLALSLKKNDNNSLFNTKYLRVSFSDNKIKDFSINCMCGYYPSLKLEKKGLNKVKDIINIYLLTGKKDKRFIEFMKKKYGIYSDNILYKFLNQIKLCI